MEAQRTAATRYRFAKVEPTPRPAQGHAVPARGALGALRGRVLQPVRQGLEAFRPQDIPSWGRAPPQTLRNGCGFVVTIKGTTFFAHGHVPYWFVREFASRRAYIYMLEIVAQLLPILAMHEQLDRYIIMFVDNEPARHALSRGFGKDDSINCLLQHSWRFLEEQSLRPAWQLVTSAANVSEEGIFEALAQKAGRR